MDMCGASRETAATCVEIKFRRPTPSTRSNLINCLISTQAANVDAAVAVKILARDAARVLARTGSTDCPATSYCRGNGVCQGFPDYSSFDPRGECCTRP